jgi:hypothetical protein
MKKRSLKDIEIQVRKILNSDFFGAYHSHFLWNGLDFRDLREYVPGDSVKRIDWKTSARSNEIFIKNFEQERDLHLIFILDLSEPMNFWSKQKTKTETLLEIFYLLSFAATASWDKVGAYIFNGNVHNYFEAKSGEENLQVIAKACEEMQSVRIKKTKDNLLEKHIKNIEKLKLHNSLLCFCTDNVEITTKELKWLNVKNQILFCNIFDSFENDLWEETYFLNLWSLTWWIFSNFHSWVKKRKYRKLRQEKIDSLSKSMRSLHIDHLQFDEATNMYIHFLQHFQQSQLWKK